MKADKRVSKIEFDRVLDTIESICASSLCRGYIIGYTSVGIRERSKPYRGNGYYYSVVLLDNLTENEALDLEERLQLECKSGKSGPAYRRKYCRHRVNHPYVRSAGGGSRKPLSPVHSIYMVWYE